MNRKKILPLAAALIFGLISARMVVKILHSKNTVQIVQGPQLAKIVMAAKDLPAGEQLEEDDLRIGQIVADSAPDKTFDDPDELVGRVLQSPIVSGQPIVEPLLADKGSGAGLQAVIPPGMRAITVVVDEVSGVAGNVTPGCHVDLVQTLHDDASSQSVGRVLLQNITVTAVGIRAEHGTDPAPGSSVTLLVTPHQAELIELATSTGRPRLVLRGSRDHRTEDIAEATFSELIGAQPARAKFSPQPAPMSDPFASGPATRPAGPQVANVWSVRVISGGETNLVDVKLPGNSAEPAITSGQNEVKPITGN